MTGRLHEPHAHFIEHGIHSITLTSSGKSDEKMTPQLRNSNMIKLLERLVRYHDQLDE
jgi:hypothetical protein